MTLIIGANLNHYTILAADTRTSWWHPLLGKWQHRDHDHKIAICKMGLVTGSGYTKALDSVKKELLKKEIYHTDDVLKIINELAIPEIELLHKYYPNMKDNTCFLISYFTSSDNEKILRLSILHSKWKYKLCIIKEPYTVMPSDTNEKYCEKYNKILNEGLHRFKECNYSEKEYIASIVTNIYKNAIVFAECFYEISKISNFVSGDFDFAAFLSNEMVVYGYGNSKEVKSGKLRLSIFHRSNQTRILTPDIFKEGDIINI